MAGRRLGRVDMLSNSNAHNGSVDMRKHTTNVTVKTKTSNGHDAMVEVGMSEEQESSEDDDDDQSVDVALNGEDDIHVTGAWMQEDSDDEQAVAGAEDEGSIDEEDYSGLGAVDDDDSQSLVDGAEEDLLKQAEKDLQQEFEEREDYIRRKKALDVEATWVTDNLVKADSQERMSSTESDEDDPLGLDASYNWNDDPFDGVGLFDPQHQMLADDADLDFWAIANAEMMQETDAQTEARPKRVRFQDISEQSGSGDGDSSDSSEDEADGDDEHFPDIFMAQDDPKIQQLLAHDTQDGILSGPASDTGSVYDFEDDADRFAFELEEDTGSSAYDTDTDSDDDSDDDINYETEDDEEIVAPHKQTPKPIKSEVPAASGNSTVTPVKQNSGKHSVPLPRRSQSATETGKTSKGPRMGTFTCDPTKATVVSDANGKTTVLYMPSKPAEKHKAFWDHARSVAHSRDSSPRGSTSFPMGSSGERTPQRPLTAESTLATMFNGNMDFMRCDDPTVPSVSDLMAITQPLLPTLFSTNFGASTVAPTDDGSEMDQDQDLDMTFNMLVDMDPDSDEDDNIVSPDITSTDQPLFLAQGVVGSFRLNQHRAKHESSLALHPASRASTNESNALQSGRRGAGNAPITPARKKRISKDMTFSSSGVKKPTSSGMSSPLSHRKRNSRGKSISGRLDQTLAPGFSMWK
nr:hypothetical protein B0A51_04077 [Rachicladosporium sp. CCFEE 5018]